MKSLAMEEMGAFLGIFRRMMLKGWIEEYPQLFGFWN